MLRFGDSQQSPATAGAACRELFQKKKLNKSRNVSVIRPGSYGSYTYHSNVSKIILYRKFSKPKDGERTCQRGIKQGFYMDPEIELEGSMQDMRRVKIF